MRAYGNRKSTVARLPLGTILARHPGPTRHGRSILKTLREQKSAGPSERVRKWPITEFQPKLGLGPDTAPLPTVDQPAPEPSDDAIRSELGGDRTLIHRCDAGATFSACCGLVPSTHNPVILRMRSRPPSPNLPSAPPITAAAIHPPQRLAASPKFVRTLISMI